MQGQLKSIRSPLQCALGLLAACAVTACSPSRFAVDRLGDALSGDSSAFATDNDPELIAAAAPFSLKLMDSLLAKSPEHRGLLTAAAAGYTQYAYGFVQTEAERIEATDLERSREQRARARNLYLRARDYGLRGIEVAHRGLSEQLRNDPVKAVQKCGKDDVALLYWTGAAWAAAIAQAKDDPAMVGDLPKPQAMMDRALQLDEAYGDGAIHSFMITYSMVRPDIAEPRIEVARQHYERAVQLSKGKTAGPHLTWAESVCVPQEDRACFDRALQAAGAVDPEAAPEHRLENTLMQRRAAWLATQADHLFLPPLPPETANP
jgi:predicted anti-sigma-YlaC factor YlaD